MARQVRRISELPEATELTGDELLEIVQDGGNHRVRVGDLPGGGAVQSVQGRTGDVVITADDVGLGNVDNTSDADKPVSTAQQAALDGKVDKVAGKGLSTNDFTDPLRDKLIGLEGTHWRGTFVSLAALQAGVTDPEAGDYADVDIVGDDVVRYIWDATDGIWVAQSGEVAPITASQVKQLYESNPDTNAFTDADEAKLDGIEAGAQVNTVTSVNSRTGAVTGLVENTDPRLSDSRAWIAETVTQTEAEAGTSTTRRAWTAQRVRQAIVAWWNSASSAFGRGFVASADAAAGRSALGLGTIATQNATNVTLASSTSGQVPLTLSKASGLGTILRVDKATDAVSYFAIESGTSTAPLLPAFRAFSNSVVGPSLFLVGDSPADMDAGNSPMVMISGRIANGTVANRPLLQIANLSSVRISVAADGSLRSVAPIRPGAYTVATLPSTADTGAEAYATNGRKAGESAGAGTGVPVYYQGGWRTYYDNSIVVA